MTPTRQYALAFLDRATNGATGVRRGDFAYERITEGRHTQASYSGCGDLANALLYALGIRVAKYINRRENSSYVVGWNVTKLDSLALAQRDWRRKPATEADIATLQPGDITIVWNRVDTRDAHVAVVRDVFKRSDGSVMSIATSDYGQGGVPHDGAQRARAVDGTFIGSRKLQRIINLEGAVARYALEPPIPLDTYFAPVKLPRPTLREGSSGPHVEALQRLLNAKVHGLGGSGPLAVDGDFGPKTDARVEVFQAAHGLTVDGVVGPKTWAKLEIP